MARGLYRPVWKSEWVALGEKRDVIGRAVGWWGKGNDPFRDLRECLRLLRSRR